MRKLAVLLAAGAVLLAGCGGASGSPSSSDRPTGKVQVLYAGSLENLMDKDVGPDYTTASGVHFEGTPAGSTELVSEIKGKIRQADVFVSASTDANNGLMGSANGDWESWYATFAIAPLVLGYNPNSRFAADLRTKPWQQVITEPGVLMGSTDPKLDPKGKLAAKALEQEHIPASRVQIFPEEQLVGRLQAGQLDAGFFYSSEAADAKIPTVSLGNVTLQAVYTVSVLNRAPNPAAGISFVNYLLGSDGLALLRKHGLAVRPVKITGTESAIPSALHGVLGVK